MEEWRRRKEGRSGEGREERAGKSSKDCESRSSFFFFFRGLGIGDEKKKRLSYFVCGDGRKRGAKKEKSKK